MQLDASPMGACVWTEQFCGREQTVLYAAGGL